MSYLVEHVYNGHDNTVDLQLTEKGVPYPHMDAVTGIKLTVAGVTFSSTNQPGDPILWDGVDFKEAEIRIYLGDGALPVGSHGAWIVLYDADHPNGLVWGAIILEVHAEFEIEGA